MQAGDIFRLRNVRTYGDDGRSYVEFRVDDHKARDLKRVFLVLLLGTEAMQVVNNKGKQVMARMNPTALLNHLGWISERQLEKAKMPKKFLERLRKVVEDEPTTLGEETT